MAVCSRHKKLQYNILPHICTCPFICCKYTTGTTPDCPSSNTRLHCNQMCRAPLCSSVNAAIGQQVSADLCLVWKVSVSSKEKEDATQPFFYVSKESYNGDVGQRWDPWLTHCSLLHVEITGLRDVNKRKTWTLYLWKDFTFTAGMGEAIGTCWGWF